LDDVGYTHSKITSLEIIEVNDSISTARMGYARYNKSGDVFHNGEGIYLFREKENKWFLVGRIESSKTEPLEANMITIVAALLVVGSAFADSIYNK
tara:strand:+ start:202 stop:489 length:288 start_codon:yes stop_codon:yes gene_type:complete